MVNERKSAEDLFEHALALKPGERAAFLDDACASSPELRDQVEELLAGDAAAGSFMKGPLFGQVSADCLDRTSAEAGFHGQEAGRHDIAKANGRFSEGDILSGRFKVVRFIAAGGMGEVYEVEDRQLQGVHLALKTILPEIAAKPDMQERFEREVLLARRVSHPNLCPIYDIFHCHHQDTALMFLTMKLLPGETLAARLKRQGVIPLAEAVPIVHQVAAALTAAHDAGILHRDIKAANIMLQGSGQEVHACVTDFGLARAYQGESTVLTAEGVAGTPGYLAPELFRGAPPSKASDVYAFGVVVYRMLSGHSPPVRLDEKDKLIRDPFMEQLPADWKRLIERCLEPTVSNRCQSFPEVIDSLSAVDRRKPHLPAPRTKLSRRRLIGLGVGAAAAAAGGVWFDWPRINFALHPLPAKRFVALLDWPTASDARIAPMITAVVDAIGNELARAEVFDHNLYIIPHHLGKDIASLSQLNDVRESLGANLVLAASGVPGTKEIQLLLRVLDPAASRTLREKKIRVSMKEQLSLPEKAVRVAAELLNITGYEPDDQRSKVGTSSPEAYAAFQKAQYLVGLPNDNGLESAIEEYKKAIDLDPRYARANAEIAWAYCRFYAVHKNPSALALAQDNCIAALALDPKIVEGHLALASVLEYRGDKEGSFRETDKALAIDPSNPRILVYQAQFYSRENRWADAERTFERVLRARPNYWWAHHELGVLYNSEGRYPEALNQFRAVTLETPQSAIAFSNVGSVYLQQGKLDEAMSNLKKSLELQATDEATSTMAAAFRAQGKYLEALEYAKKAVSLGPEDSYNWLELGECYSFLPKRKKEVMDAFAKSDTLQEQELQTNPADGPGWMILALIKIKLGSPQDAAQLVEKSERLSADDIDSQLFKARILELLGRRDESLATIARCLKRGATLFQFQTMPDMQAVLKDSRFEALARSGPSTT